MRTALAVTGALALALAAPSAVKAQNPPRSGVVYDRSKVDTLSGEVAAISATPSPSALGGGLHILVRMSGQLYDVHLAPQWFLDSKRFTLATGDQVQVSGSRLTYEGKLVFLAARITLGQKTVTLRDSSGAPAWSTKGRGGSPR